MRTVILAALLLAGCGSHPLEVKIPTLPGATHLQMPDALPLRRYNYKLEVRSAVAKQARLEARLEDPAPEGVEVRIGGDATIPREGTGWPTLVVIVPKKPGAFQGTIALTSPEVPDWVQRYTFAGNVADRPPEGRHMVPRPAGVDLGTLVPGEEKAFAVALASVGSEPVTITGWESNDPDVVRIQRIEDAVVVRPGGELQLVGTAVAPNAAGPFEAAVRVRSDAQGYQNGIFGIRFGGVVVLDYAPQPPRAVETAAYPAAGTEFKLKIVAREGVAPFTVAEALGHERYLEVVSLGTKEPAREQLITLKLRRDAPTDAARPAEWKVRFRIEPGDLEVAWPMKLFLFPPIHASPREVQFGAVAQGAGTEAEIFLTAIPGRTFRVTGARSEGRRLRVTIPEHALGGVWKVDVGLPESLPKGVLTDRIVIETDDPDVPQLVVPVRAEIR
ncbi:MAG TPA: hypothetical protein VFY93_11750 [Planctomycetota bacterium]|nr:hypothetical protein [Planctomycetota bacterium]